MPCLPDIKNIFLPADTSGESELPPPLPLSKRSRARPNLHFWTISKPHAEMRFDATLVPSLQTSPKSLRVTTRFSFATNERSTDSIRQIALKQTERKAHRTTLGLLKQQQVTNLMITALKGLKGSSKLFRTPGKFRKPANVWKVKVLEPGRDFIINIAPLSRESALPAIVVAQPSLSLRHSLSLSIWSRMVFATLHEFPRALSLIVFPRVKSFFPLPETMNQQPGETAPIYINESRVFLFLFFLLFPFCQAKGTRYGKLFVHLFGSRRMSLAGRKPIDEPCFPFFSRMGKSVLRYGNRVESVDGDVVPAKLSPPHTWKRHKINSLSRAGIQLQMYFHKDSIESVT